VSQLAVGAAAITSSTVAPCPINTRILPRIR
jgi:hypothetical protein